MKILLIILTSFVILTLVFLLNITTFYDGNTKHNSMNQNANKRKRLNKKLHQILSALARNSLPDKLSSELDKDIVGQDEAKKAVAVALRNRYRRKLVEPELREGMPKNILMSGPTEVGKTEIALED